MPLIVGIVRNEFHGLYSIDKIHKKEMHSYNLVFKEKHRRTSQLTTFFVEKLWLHSISSNTFTPIFLKWTLPYLNLFQIYVYIKPKNKMANSTDSDEMAPDEPSHQDLHCLQRYLFWSAMLEELNQSKNLKTYL